MESDISLTPTSYTTEECNALIDFVLALRKSYLQSFLKQINLPMYGTKPDLRMRFQEAIKKGILTPEQLIDFLDSVSLWGKQHVFLYKGPQNDIQSWKDPNYVLQLLKQHNLEKLFNARLPLFLPEKLTLSSVIHSDGKIRITAIQKREYSERTPKYDEERETPEGERITLTAHVHRLTRTLVSFEWDLQANTAMLQITQLQEDEDYEKVADEFFHLIGLWLDIKQFSTVDLRKTIRKLHELEENQQAEARSHGIQYRSLRGRRVSAYSPSQWDSVLGEAHIDRAMSDIRKNGVGHIGNFYWLPNVNHGPIYNPLHDEIHVIIVGSKSRINFPTPNTEMEVRYVLHRVRSLS